MKQINDKNSFEIIDFDDILNQSQYDSICSSNSFHPIMDHYEQLNDINQFQYLPSELDNMIELNVYQPYESNNLNILDNFNIDLNDYDSLNQIQKKKHTQQNKNQELTNCECYLCIQTLNRTKPLNKQMKPIKLCVLILLSLQQLYPNKKQFSFSRDILSFIINHWSYLQQLDFFHQNHWKQQLLHTLNTSSLIKKTKSDNLVYS